MAKITICDNCKKQFDPIDIRAKLESGVFPLIFKSTKYSPSGKWKYVDLCLECIKKAIEQIEQRRKSEHP